jgi:chromosome segregation ATPase
MKLSIDSFHRQSEETAQRATVDLAESDRNLLSLITERFNTLVRNFGTEDQILKLRETKNTLEERVRGNENLLAEVRMGKASSEKREIDLKAGNEKLVEEFAKLREMASTTRKNSGPMIELQSLLMKWTSTNSLLAESLQRIEGKDQKLHAQEEQIRSLSDQLSHAKANQQNSVEELQKMSESLAEHADASNRKEGQLVSVGLKPQS